MFDSHQIIKEDGLLSSENYSVAMHWANKHYKLYIYAQFPRPRDIQIAFWMVCKTGYFKSAARVSNISWILFICLIFVGAAADQWDYLILFNGFLFSERILNRLFCIEQEAVGA